MARTGICITTKNEACTIGKLLEGLKTLGYKNIYIVDEQSTDGTAEYAYEMSGANIVINKGWQGIGPSLKQAWLMALDDGCDYIVQMDAGGSHSPYDIGQLLSIRRTKGVVEKGDIVVGSRFITGSMYLGSNKRYHLSKLATAMCNRKTGAHFTDWTSGFRLFTREAALVLWHVPTVARMHGWHIEILNWARRLRLGIVERPITYTSGVSSFNKTVAMEAFNVWLRL